MGVAKKEHGRELRGAVWEAFRILRRDCCGVSLARGIGTIFGSGVGHGLDGRTSWGGGGHTEKLMITVIMRKTCKACLRILQMSKDCKAES